MENLEKARVLHGDCLDVLKTLADNSVDAVVTDPPYGLSFMGKKWDYDVPSVEIWAECLRVLKPGGHLLAFAGTRTQHRMAVRIEDAGFEIRDMIAWVYGSGFPKSHDVSKAIDKAAGAKGHDSIGFNVAGIGESNGGSKFRSDHPDYVKPIGITEAARHWQGWGTALKPALEPITVARKPLIGTVAENVLAHGAGGLNIDGCRVGNEIIVTTNGKGFKGSFEGGENNNGGATREGRWPANLIHDGGEEVLACFPETKGGVAVRRNSGGNTFGGDKPKPQMDDIGYGDSGSAARFFYCAKASKRDRDEGLDGFDARLAGCMNMRNDAHAQANGLTYSPKRNHHPTVKPTDLMRYLCRLVTPPNGIVLDPFTGSGSTGKAAVIEGFQFIGIEREAEYVEIARARIGALDILNNK
jgi:DNA modification methylase